MKFDNVDPQRSRTMAQVKSKNTSCELKLRKALWAYGVRGWRVSSSLKGKPDIVFTRQRVVIFIDGCFWHGCPMCCRMPSTRKDYWEAKIGKNIQRDKLVTEFLFSQGWTVLRFWEHEITRNIDGCIQKVIDCLNLKDSQPKRL